MLAGEHIRVRLTVRRWEILSHCCEQTGMIHLGANMVKMPKVGFETVLKAAVVLKANYTCCFRNKISATHYVLSKWGNSYSATSDLNL